jgi:hypothetical protein
MLDISPLPVAKIKEMSVKLRISLPDISKKVRENFP